MTNEQLATLVEQITSKVLSELSVDTTVEQEDKYIIFIGKKPRNVKAPYIAINADGQLSSFTEEADVRGLGTDRIGKFTLAEIAERFPQFNDPYFLVKVN